MDLISIIIPVYNVAPFIEKCLNSVLAQDYRNLEIILINDGSTDRSGTICDAYAKKDSRIIVEHQENAGVSTARNVGVSLAKGKYIVFVDSDDVVATDLVTYLYNLVHMTSAEIGICNHVHGFQGEVPDFFEETEQIVFDKESAIVELLYQHSFLISLWGKIFPRNFFEGIRFPDGRIFEDSAVVYRLFDKANTIAYGNAGKYAYLHREKSITTKKFSMRDCDILDICEEMERYFAKRSEALRQAAKVYHGASALRIYMNAPKKQEFDEAIKEAKMFLNQNCKVLLADANIRRKMKIALLMYRYMKPLMPVAYQFVNRWK